MEAIHEFGSNNPKLIYLALRWNGDTIDKSIEGGMPASIALALKHLRENPISVSPKDIRIYNLVGPEKDRGMELHPNELGEARRTIRSIVARSIKSDRLKAIVVGGKSGIMPLVALTLKLLMPKRRVELRNHHKARKVNAIPLGLIMVL